MMESEREGCNTWSQPQEALPHRHSPSFLRSQPQSLASAFFTINTLTGHPGAIINNVWWWFIVRIWGHRQWVVLAKKSPKFQQMLITAYTDKSTDENLTSENWELIMNLCDKVQDEGQAGYVVDPSVCWISAKWSYFQSSRRHCFHSQTSRASESQCPTICLISRRVAQQEPRHRNPSRAGIKSLHSRAWEAHHRSSA